MNDQPFKALEQQEIVHQENAHYSFLKQTVNQNISRAFWDL